MTIKRTLIITVFLLILTGCASKNTVTDRNGLETLVSWMTGSFSSEAQAIEDTNYFDIRLNMYPIWRDTNDGYWIYVEQAVHGYENKPYRQRIYNVVQIGENLFESRVYEINEPLRFAQKFREPGFLGNLNPDSLTMRDGCSILLRRQCEDVFSGNTVGRMCASDLHGATHAVSEVVLTYEYMKSWDRGYDDNDIQIWGPENGPYIFSKIEDYE